MPKIRAPKESFEGRKQLVPGIYDFRLDGFNVKKNKAGDGYNLNPSLKVINNVDFNEAFMPRVWMSDKAGWEQKDFCHALGVPMGPDGEFPGEFVGPDDKPEDWQYMGPLVGRTGKAEVILEVGNDNKTYPHIKRYFCVVQGCKEKHTESL